MQIEDDSLIKQIRNSQSFPRETSATKKKSTKLNEIKLSTNLLLEQCL